MSQVKLEVGVLARFLTRRFSPTAVAKRKKELKERNEGEDEPESMIIQPTKLPNGEEDVTVDHLAVYEEDSDIEEEGEVPFEKGPDAFYDDISQSTAPMHVLPLYSLLDEKKQLRIWDPIPEGERLVPELVRKYIDDIRHFPDIVPACRKSQP